MTASIPSINIEALVPLVSQPDYDKEVLQPLHAAEAKAEEARQAAREAAQRLEQEQAAQLVEEQARAAQIVSTPVVLAPVPSGTHEDWMAAAAISPSDYGYVNYIVDHESGWRVTVQAPNGPYGLGQAWPGNKMAPYGADWATNPITQLRWASVYAQKYGGWYGAYVFWLAHHSW